MVLKEYVRVVDLAQAAIDVLRDVNAEIKKLPPDRSFSIASTKIEEACHWLRDRVEQG